jgi:broad specificity phosphatase PhoE
VTEDAPEPQIWLVRHGETEWSKSGRHTGRSDIPLTDLGLRQADALARRLANHRFALVLSSPRSRAVETARLAGFADPVIDPDLREWDYGEFEGRTTADIRTEIEDWSVWTGPWRGGETVEQVAVRADRVIERCLDTGVEGDVLLFAHGHLLRVLAARWIHLPADSGSHLALGTATVGILGWEHANRAIETWNEACHLSA